MSELPQNLVDDAPAGVTAAPQSPHFGVGAALRDARIQSGMSVTEVSSRIKFAPRQIEALEADDYAQLPEIAFVRGFVRGYARLLALDADALLAALPQGVMRAAPEEANVLAEVPFPNTYSARKPNIMWLGAGLVVAVVLGLFVWLSGGTSDVSGPQSQVMTLDLPDAMTLENEAPVPVRAVVEPATTVSIAAQMPTAATAVKPAPATQSAPLAEVKPVLAQPEVVKPAIPAPPSVTVKRLVSAPANPLPDTAKTVPVKPAAALPVPVKPSANAPVDTSARGLTLIHFAFDNESWVEVKDKNGKPLLGQLNAQGTELNVRGEPPFTLLIGNSGGVRLTYKGKSIDLAPHSNAQVAHLTLE